MQRWAWNQPGTDVTTMTIPNPDPGESFQDMNYQLFGTPLKPGQSPSVAGMRGFVADYAPVPPARHISGSGDGCVDAACPNQSAAEAVGRRTVVTART